MAFLCHLFFFLLPCPPCLPFYVSPAFAAFMPAFAIAHAHAILLTSFTLQRIKTFECGARCACARASFVTAMYAGVRRCRCACRRVRAAPQKSAFAQKVVRKSACIFVITQKMRADSHRRTQRWCCAQRCRRADTPPRRVRRRRAFLHAAKIPPRARCRHHAEAASLR